MIDGCKNNPENLITTKVGEYIPSDFSMSTMLSVKNTECKYGVYRGKYCTRKFCASFREHAMKVIKFKIKKWSY